MPTQKQIDANRRNAQKSTGPRTPEGKAASRFNAAKHKLYAAAVAIPEEEIEQDLTDLIQAYLDEWDPQTPTELHLVNRLAACDWLHHRYLRLEREMFCHYAAENSCWPNYETVNEDGRHLARYPDRYAVLHRQMNANQRTWDRALATLQQVRRPAPAPPAPPQPTLSKASNPPLASFPQIREATRDLPPCGALDPAAAAFSPSILPARAA